MDAEWYKNKIDAIIEETKDPEYFKEEDAIKQKNFEDFDPTNLFRDVWDAGEMDEGELQRMMASWKTQAEKSMGYYDEVIDQPPVETIIEVPKVDHFKFEENNPYDGVDDAYTLALQLNEELKVHDAVLALKAHLTKEPDHAASWRLLGQLYQEKDEDDKAIAYFKRAYELDPYD
jgi:tetratricopeptide (TPR) repeat protein